jgi:hypothetical protein
MEALANQKQLALALHEAEVLMPLQGETMQLCVAGCHWQIEDCMQVSAFSVEHATEVQTEPCHEHSGVSEHWV